MNAECVDALDRPVNTDRNGLPVKPDRAMKRFKAMARKAGLDDRVHLHSLRHTTGAWLAMQGVPMRAIQSILGHSSINVTEQYSHFALETLNSAMEEAFGSE
jgi:site-specific recombinase XerD